MPFSGLGCIESPTDSGQPRWCPEHTAELDNLFQANQGENPLLDGRSLGSVGILERREARLQQARKANG